MCFRKTVLILLLLFCVSFRCCSDGIMFTNFQKLVKYRCVWVVL